MTIFGYASASSLCIERGCTAIPPGFTPGPTYVVSAEHPDARPLHDFTISRSAAPACSGSKHTDWHANQNGFADIVVNGTQFTVRIYSSSGTLLFSKTFTG